jgi:hypothetical protein
VVGRASHDVDDDRRYAALNRSGVGDRNFLRVHTAVSAKDVAVDRCGMGFPLQQNRCGDCGNAARCSDLGDAGNLCRRIPSWVLEPSAFSGPTRAFSPVWFARLHALARFFAGRLACLLACLYWFAFPGYSLRHHCLFSYALADQPRADAGKTKQFFLSISVVVAAGADRGGSVSDKVVCGRGQRPRVQHRSIDSVRDTA